VTGWRTLAAFESASEPGGERDVVARVIEAVAPLHLTRDACDRLGTAVAETVMNAIEHGNHNDPALSVETTVRTDGGTVEVLVSDRGGLRELPEHPEIPDLDAKLEGLQRPRGWGLFLVRSMVDSMDVVADPDDPTRHTARLRMTVVADGITVTDGAAEPPDHPPAQEGPRHAEHV
jgi:anti-sigma regulatory factor (Ser/Thr protein kinase)